MIDVHGVMLLSYPHYAMAVGLAGLFTLITLYNWLTRLRRARWSAQPAGAASKV